MFDIHIRFLFISETGSEHGFPPLKNQPSKHSKRRIKIDMDTLQSIKNRRSDFFRAQNEVINDQRRKDFEFDGNVKESFL